MVKRLVTFGREDDCGSKSTDVSREVNEEMKFWFADQDTRGTLSRNIEKIFDYAG